MSEPSEDWFEGWVERKTVLLQPHAKDHYLDAYGDLRPVLEAARRVVGQGHDRMCTDNPCDCGIPALAAALDAVGVPK